MASSVTDRDVLIGRPSTLWWPEISETTSQNKSEIVSVRYVVTEP